MIKWNIFKSFLIRNSISSVFQQVKDKMEQIPFIQEQYFSNRTKFKPKRNIFVNFGNNVISLEQVWVIATRNKTFFECFFYFNILEHCIAVLTQLSLGNESKRCQDRTGPYNIWAKKIFHAVKTISSILAVSILQDCKFLNEWFRPSHYIQSCFASNNW